MGFRLWVPNFDRIIDPVSSLPSSPCCRPAADLSLSFLRMIGMGFAGMTRRFIVYPEHCICLLNLATIALNKSFVSPSLSRPMRQLFGRTLTLSPRPTALGQQPCRQRLAYQSTQVLPRLLRRLVLLVLASWIARSVHRSFLLFAQFPSDLNPPVFPPSELLQLDLLDQPYLCSRVGRLRLPEWTRSRPDPCSRLVTMEGIDRPRSALLLHCQPAPRHGHLGSHHHRVLCVSWVLDP